MSLVLLLWFNYTTFGEIAIVCTALCENVQCLRLYFDLNSFGLTIVYGLCFVRSSMLILVCMSMTRISLIENIN